MKDYLWILKNKACGLKNQAPAHYWYWVIQKHVLENYIQHDKSLQLLWKASKKKVTKTPSRNYLSFLAFSGVDEWGSFFLKGLLKAIWSELIISYTLYICLFSV